MVMPTLDTGESGTAATEIDGAHHVETCQHLQGPVHRGATEPRMRLPGAAQHFVRAEVFMCAENGKHGATGWCQFEAGGADAALQCMVVLDHN